MLLTRSKCDALNTRTNTPHNYYKETFTVERRRHTAPRKTRPQGLSVPVHRHQRRAQENSRIRAKSHKATCKRKLVPAHPVDGAAPANTPARGWSQSAPPTDQREHLPRTAKRQWQAQTTTGQPKPRDIQNGCSTRDTRGPREIGARSATSTLDFL